VKTFTNPPPDPDAANTAAWRAADVGGANGHGNARSLARILSLISLGGNANGVQLLRPETIPYVPDGKIRRTSFAYVMNKMAAGIEGSERTARYMTLFYEALA
jgi:hypothetical protein